MVEQNGDANNALHALTHCLWQDGDTRGGKSTL